MVFGLVQGAKNKRSQHPRFRTQAAVARGHRQAIGLSHGGTNHEFDRKGQVCDEPTHYGGLLQVFLAEVGVVGLHDVEQPRHHDAHTVEVAGAEGTFHGAFELAEIEFQDGRLSVHFLRRRRKHQVAARRFQHHAVGF